MIYKTALYVLILLTALPLGIFITKLCKDELIKDKKYFILMFVLFFILLILSLIYFNFLSLILTLMYGILFLLVLISKSK